MAPPKRRKLRSRLVVLVLVAVIPVALSALIIAVLFERQYRASVESSLVKTASALTVAVDHELIASISTLQALATARALDAGDLKPFYEEAQRVLRTHRSWTTITLSDDHGQQVLNLLRPLGSALPFSGDVPVVRSVIASQAPAISDLFSGSVTRAPIIAITVPVTREGRLRYVLGAGIEVASLSRLLSEGRLPPDWIATIIDRAGIIVGRTRGIDRLLGTPGSPTFVAQSRGDYESSFRDVTREGIPVYGALSRSRVSGWTVGLGVPAEQVEAPGRTTLLRLAAGGLASLALACALGLVFGRRISRAIGSLTDSARALAEGEVPDAPGSSGIAEIDSAVREMRTVARSRAAALEDRRKTERALAESEERTRLLVARALDAVVTIDGQGRVTSWNPQAEALFGWRRAEVMGRLLSETIIPPARREEHERDLVRFRATGEGPVLNRRLEMTALHRDGRELAVELTITPLRVQGQVTFGAFLRDVTERKRAEAARLHRAEEPFRLLVAGVKDYAIFMLDPGGRVMSWNAGAERIKGYRAQEIIGQHFSRFYPDEDVRAGKPAAELATAVRAGRFAEEAWRLRRDGSRFWASVTIRPLYDEAGALRGYAKVTRDETERRAAQTALEEQARALEDRSNKLEAAQEELMRRERLAMVGELASGVSHELRNPLGVIKNSAFYLEMVLPDEAKVRKHLRILNQEVETAARVVTELVDFSRVQAPAPALVELGGLVEASLARAVVPETIAVVRRLAPDLPAIFIDREQIGLAVANLIGSAVLSMREGGTLTVETARTGSGVGVSVEDTGPGIAPEELGKIFEPLRPAAVRGVGLRLFIVKDLVEANGGRITVQSEPGRGARIVVAFDPPNAVA